MPKVLLGFMGAGKTTIGSLLDPAFADMDALLVRRLEMPISDYFARYGEDSFRQQESLLLHELLNQESSVISTGGASSLSQKIVSFSRRILVIFIYGLILSGFIKDWLRILQLSAPSFLIKNQKSFVPCMSNACPFMKK